MPFTDNAGVPIHYEIEGDGAPLVLMHGAADSLQLWYERGYVDALKAANRLILIDARGHGVSGKPHKPEAYSTERMVSDVTSVLDHLGVEKAHYFGYSMGGYTGFGMAQYAPERVITFILGGASPTTGASAYTGPDGDIMLKAFQSGPKAVLPAFGKFVTPALEARLLANDSEALIAWRRAHMARPGFEEVLADIQVPTLLFAGSADTVHDQVQAGAAKLAVARFVSLPGLAHIEALYRSELALPHILEFLAELDN